MYSFKLKTDFKPFRCITVVGNMLNCHENIVTMQTKICNSPEKKRNFILCKI